MLELLEAAPEFSNACPADRFAPRGARPLSKFERRATRESRNVWDRVFLAHDA